MVLDFTLFISSTSLKKWYYATTKKQDIEALESHMKAYREGFIKHIDTYYSDPVEPEPQVSEAVLREGYVII